MTVVESQAAGTPVIAFNGGGFREWVIDGVTGILIHDTDEKTLETALKTFNGVKWNREKLISNSKKFSKERFIKEISEFVKRVKK